MSRPNYATLPKKRRAADLKAESERIPDGVELPKDPESGFTHPHHIIERNFEKWAVPDEIENRIFLITGDDDAFADHLRRAYYWSATRPGQQFSAVLRRHDDRTGKFDIVVKAMQYDLPDFNQLPGGRYRLVLKYYDWNNRVKGGKVGGVKTVYRDFTKEWTAPASAPAQAFAPSPGVAGGGEEGRIDPPAGIPSGSYPRIDEYRAIFADIDKAYREAMQFHLETLRTRSELEKAAFDRGFEAGKRAAMAESVPPVAPVVGSGNGMENLMMTLIMNAMQGKTDAAPAVAGSGAPLGQ